MNSGRIYPNSTLTLRNAALAKFAESPLSEDTAEAELLSRPTPRRSTPITTTALPFSIRLDLEGVAMSMQLNA
jgi:hypothetical protein